MWTLSQGIVEDVRAELNFGCDILLVRYRHWCVRTSGICARKYSYGDSSSCHVLTLTACLFPLVLQLTNEPHFSQGMFHFDYRVGSITLHRFVPCRRPGFWNWSCGKLDWRRQWSCFLVEGATVSCTVRMVSATCLEINGVFALEWYVQGKDYQTQLQLGNNAFYGFNYIQVQCPEFVCWPWLLSAWNTWESCLGWDFMVLGGTNV